MVKERDDESEEEGKERGGRAWNLGGRIPMLLAVIERVTGRSSETGRGRNADVRVDVAVLARKQAGQLAYHQRVFPCRAV